jgi:hypothetical protein
MAKVSPISAIIQGIDRFSEPVRRFNAKLDSIQAPVRALNRSLAALSKETRLPQLGGALRNVGTEVGALSRRASLLATIAGGGAAFGFKKLVDGADDLGDVADAAGIGVEALQKYRFAAGRVGVEQQQLDAGIRNFARSFALLQGNAGPLKSILDRLPPSLRAPLRAAKGTEQGLEALWSTLDQVPDAGARLAVLQAAFGRSGTQLNALLANGKQGLVEMLEQADRFGEVLDADTVAAMSRASDGIGDLGRMVRGLGTTFATGALPAVNRIIERILKFYDANRKLIHQRVAKWGADFGRILESVAGFLERVLPPTMNFVEQIGGLRTVALLAGAAVSAKLIVAIAGLGSALASVLLRLPALATGLRVVGLALVGTPLGAAIAAATTLAGLGYLLYDRWQPFRQMVDGIAVKIGLMSAFRGAGASGAWSEDGSWTTSGNGGATGGWDPTSSSMPAIPRAKPLNMASLWRAKAAAEQARADREARARVTVEVVGAARVKNITAERGVDVDLEQTLALGESMAW